MIDRNPVAVTRNCQGRNEWREYGRKGVNSHQEVTVLGWGEVEKEQQQGSSLNV